jgi:hypothetical protein
MSAIKRISSNPTSLLFISVFCGYVLFFLPWINLDVRPIIDPNHIIKMEVSEEPPVIEPVTKINARFWDNPVIYDCSVGYKLDWSTAVIERSNLMLRVLGWIVPGLMTVLWCISLIVNRRVKPVISRFVFVILSILFLIVGMEICVAITPWASCIQLISLTVTRVWLFWPSVFIGAAGIVLALLSIYIHYVDNSAVDESVLSAS